MSSTLRPLFVPRLAVVPAVQYHSLQSKHVSSYGTILVGFGLSPALETGLESGERLNLLSRLEVLLRIAFAGIGIGARVNADRYGRLE